MRRNEHVVKNSSFAFYFPLLIAMSIVALTVISCSKKITSNTNIDDVTVLNRYAESVPENLNESELRLRKIKDSAQNYTPYDGERHAINQKIIRVNFHFIHPQKGSLNFKGNKCVKAAHDLINTANKYLKRNEKMRLPEGNNTAQLDCQIQYQITPLDANDASDIGIYEHKDDDFYYFVKKGKNRNNYNKNVIKKYGVATDSILNIFVQIHHPDSIRSEQYSNTQNGIALGTSLKLAGWNEFSKTPEQISALLNHEVGHIFGLAHSWRSNDRCDDTPQNENCWSGGKEPPCDGVTSNNMMDYNNSQRAITPCQIGTMHKSCQRLKTKQRKLLVKNWCALDTTQDIVINRDTDWLGARDIAQHIVITGKSTLRIANRVSLAKGATITIAPKATLILDRARLHNDCGDTWGGIIIEKNKKTEGKIVTIGAVVLDNLD